MNMKRFSLSRSRVVFLVLVAVAGAAILYTRGGEDRRTITGVMVLRETSRGDSFTAASTGSCAGRGGYSDIIQGATVTVTDQTGTIIATTGLAAGAMSTSSNTLDRPQPAVPVVDDRTCQFAFSVKVPQRAFYGIEVTRRGKLTYSAAELTKVGNYVEMTLGKT